MSWGRIATSLILTIASCSHIAVVGIGPRGGAESEVEIVGPTDALPTDCENPRFVDELTTPYAIDVRCVAVDGYER
jgi:hypothetical protein